MADSPHEVKPSVTTWHMNDAEAYTDKLSVEPTSNAEELSDMAPAQQPVSQPFAFTNTFIWLGITITSALFVYYAMFINQDLGFALAWGTLGTFLLAPIVCGIITLVLFAVDVHAWAQR